MFNYIWYESSLIVVGKVRNIYLKKRVKLKAIKLEQVRTKVKASKTPEQTHTNINTFFTYIAKL